MTTRFNILEHTKSKGSLESKVAALLKSQVTELESFNTMFSIGPDTYNDLTSIECGFNSQLKDVKTGNNMKAHFAYRLEHINKDNKLAGLQLVHVNLNCEVDRKVISIIPKEVTNE